MTDDYELKYSTLLTLSPRSREIIETNYRPEVEIHLQTPVEPPSTRDSLDEVIQNMEKLKHNGFINEFNSKDMKDLYYLSQNSILNSFTPKSKSKEEEAEEAVQHDPRLEFWLNTDTLTNYIKELRKLPFVEGIYLVRALTKMRESAIHVAQKINSRSYDKRNKSPTQMNNDMREFILTLQQTFKNIMESSITKGMLNIDLLPEEYKKTYKYCIPKKPIETQEVKKVTRPTEKDIGLEKQMAQRLSETTQVFTPSYQMDMSYGLDKSSRKTILSKLEMNVNRQFKSAMDNVPNIKSGRALVLPPLTETLSKEEDHKAKSSRASSTLASLKKPIIPKVNKKEILPPLHNAKGKRDDIIKTYWMDTDPLQKVRQGNAYNAVGALANITNGFSFEHKEPVFTKEELYYPFTPPKQPETPQKQEIKPEIKLEEKPKENEKDKEKKENARLMPSEPLLLKFWSTAQFENTIDPNEEEEEKEKSENDPKQRPPAIVNAGDQNNNNSSSTITFDAKDLISMTNKREAALEYLKNYGAVDLTTNSLGDEEFERLKKIWDRLGFTTAQKLSLVSKYSQSIEDTKKLYESLGFWETTFTSVDHFKKSYRLLRDYLKYESYSKQTFSGPLKELIVEFLRAQHLLIQNAENLQKLYGDELIIKGHPYRFELDMKKEKIRQMLADHDVSLPENISLF